MPEIKVRCMHCHSEGKIEVPEALHERRGAGIANVFVQRGQLCDHEFLAFVDKNYKVRGYSPVDYIPEVGTAAPAITYKNQGAAMSPEEETRLNAISTKVDPLLEDCLKSKGISSIFLLDWRGRIITRQIHEGEFGFDQISGIVTEIMAMGTQVGDRLQLADIKRFHMVGQENDAIVEKVGDAHVLVVVYTKAVKLGLLNFEIKNLQAKLQPLLEGS